MDKAADIPLIGMARVKSVHPKKFGMWLFIVSVLMLFAALTQGHERRGRAVHLEHS